MTPVLEAREVSLLYRSGGTESYAVRRVSLAIGEGEFCGVMGPSGNGKSSLLYLLSGLKPPSSGDVRFRGRDYRSLGARGLADLRRREYGFIFQQHFLINYLTVLENVLVAVPSEARAAGRARAMQLLERLGLGDEHLRRHPYQLSGGQRQRVAVARALAGRPQVVFADEPTASLDRATAAEVVRVLEEYRNEGGTVVLVTHDPGVVRGADRILVMRDGELDRGEGREDSSAAHE